MRHRIQTVILIGMIIVASSCNEDDAELCNFDLNNFPQCDEDTNVCDFSFVDSGSYELCPATFLTAHIKMCSAPTNYLNHYDKTGVFEYQAVAFYSKGLEIPQALGNLVVATAQRGYNGHDYVLFISEWHYDESKKCSENQSSR